MKEVEMPVNARLLKGGLPETLNECMSSCDVDSLDERTVSLLYFVANAVSGNKEGAAEYVRACRASGLSEEEISHATCIASCIQGRNAAQVACDAFRMACDD
jgi:alkylhydroperoxidase/carboxymuconolactone decarboxylase family protein YurZ